LGFLVSRRGGEERGKMRGSFVLIIVHCIRGGENAPGDEHRKEKKKGKSVYNITNRERGGGKKKGGSKKSMGFLKLGGGDSEEKEKGGKAIAPYLPFSQGGRKNSERLITAACGDGRGEREGD